MNGKSNDDIVSLGGLKARTENHLKGNDGVEDRVPTILIAIEEEHLLTSNQPFCSLDMMTEVTCE